MQRSTNRGNIAAVGNSKLLANHPRLDNDKAWLSEGTSLQEHLGALGAISKQAQGFVDGAASLAKSLLQTVMDDFRY